MGALELPAGWAENVKWPQAPEEVLIPAIIRAVRIEPWRLRPLHASAADDSAQSPAVSFPVWPHVICSGMEDALYDFIQACGCAGGDR